MICKRVCKLDRYGYCRKCRRSLTEIMNWASYSNDQKQDIMEKIKYRNTFPPVYIDKKG